MAGRGLARHRCARRRDPVPDDETFAKLDFYRRHGVSELLVADWRSRTVRCLALQEDPQERDHSDVLGLTTAQIEAEIDWPPLAD